MCIFTITCIFTIHFILLYAVELATSIWLDLFHALRNASMRWCSDPIDPLFAQDQAPYPGSHRRDLLSNSDYMQYYYPMLKYNIYKRHYKRHIQQKQPIDICAICRENFTPFDLNNDVYITSCAHLFHRQCLYKHCTVKNSIYSYDQQAPCPLCNGNIKFDYLTQLYDPAYLEEYEFSFGMDLYDPPINFKSIYQQTMNFFKSAVSFYGNMANQNSKIFEQIRPNYYV